VNQTFCIDINDAKIAVVRNPYERIISLYRGSWNWIGILDWVQKYQLKPQCELYKDYDYVICLESWEDDCNVLGITPDKNSMEMLKKKYSEDYRRWYGRTLLKIVAPLVKPDLDTYGYRF
tara:strand:+ start:7289 stop:7648 length:360 start_codon:yes stop_codon:yes gene_type:complete